MTLRHHGVGKLGRLIDHNFAQAKYVGQLVAASNNLELTAPVGLNITCFCFRAVSFSEKVLKHLNTEIMLRLQEEGIAAPSETSIASRHYLRAAIVNHRARREDLNLLVREIRRIGGEIMNEGAVLTS